MPGTLMSSRHAEFDLTKPRITLSKAVICVRNCRQATSMGRTINAMSERPASRASTFRSKAIRALRRQKAKSLEYAPDVIGQSCRHADELGPRTEKSTRAVAVERLDMNRPVPPGANDLSQSL